MTIQTNYDTVNDPRVYGNRIATYTIDGTSGGDFADVLAFASFKQSHAIEAATSAFSKTVDFRKQKVSDLSEVAATLAEAIGSMDSDDSSTTKKSSIDAAKLKSANEKLAYWGMAELSLTDGQITYAEATRKQNTVNTALDTENNDLQQALSLLESFISRRDNAFTVASKIIRKDDNTASTTIKSMGV